MKIFLPHKVQINLVALRSSVIIAGHAPRILLSIILEIKGFDQIQTETLRLQFSPPEFDKSSLIINVS